MTNGTRFTLYAYALDSAGRLRGIANRRVKRDGGSDTTRDRWLSVSWPCTKRGADAAAKWASANSQRSWRRATRVNG